MAARYSTDVLLIDWSPWLQFGAGSHMEIHEAVAAALMLSGAKLLDLDARELGVMTDIPVGPGGNGLGTVIYDNTAGGCGHVRELLARGREWIEEAHRLLWGSKEHNDSCKHGCLSCILSFAPGNEAATGRPDRVGAEAMLAALLGRKTWAAPQPATGPGPKPCSHDPKSEGGCVRSLQDLSVRTRQLLPKLQGAAKRAGTGRRVLIESLVDDLRAGQVPELFYPLLQKVVSDGFSIPRAKVGLADTGYSADLLWDTPRGKLVLHAGKFEIPETLGGEGLTIYCTDIPDWEFRVHAWLTDRIGAD